MIKTAGHVYLIGILEQDASEVYIFEKIIHGMLFYKIKHATKWSWWGLKSCMQTNNATEGVAKPH